ncbi:MAG: hypothetical protein RLZZ341_1796 [Pseudomonadota bacterium]|jgi:hypothetical protein
MPRRNPVLSPVAAALVGLALTASMPALAASSASSASSQGSSASSGSVSDSFETSSDASSKGNKVAEGDYRLVQVATAAQPGRLRLTFEGTGGVTGTFVLVVPEATLQQAALALGDTITARTRSYGWEFAARATQQPFFLVVHDEQQREFATRKITL